VIGLSRRVPEPAIPKALGIETDAKCSRIVQSRDKVVAPQSQKERATAFAFKRRKGRSWIGFFKKTLAWSLQILRDLLRFQVAQTTCAASRAAKGAEREGGQQAAPEFLLEIAVGGAFSKRLFCLGSEPVDQLIYLAATLALAGSIDQLVQAFDECAVAPVRRDVAGTESVFPTE
jgi:hypothetical protein